MRQSEEASVALYSLGDPAALAQATAEVVDLLSECGLLSPGRTTLEIGCGGARTRNSPVPRAPEHYLTLR